MTSTSTSTSAAFEKARAEDRAALIGYLPAGYPSVEGSIKAFRTMVGPSITGSL